jgi:hypothetical protein
MNFKIVSVAIAVAATLVALALVPSIAPVNADSNKVQINDHSFQGSKGGTDNSRCTNLVTSANCRAA